MKKILFLMVCCAALTVQAQDAPGEPLHTQDRLPRQEREFRFGYLSYEKALASMPDYAAVQQSLADLRRKYEAELDRVGQEFNKKYEEFLEGRADFPPTILRKRQTELQELMDRNVAFREEARQELQKAETAAIAPLRERLDAAIAEVAAEHRLAFVLNTDQNACPYVSPDTGNDITLTVVEKLKNSWP
jgi:outer membrane protein